MGGGGLGDEERGGRRRRAEEEGGGRRRKKGCMYKATGAGWCGEGDEIGAAPRDDHGVPLVLLPDNTPAPLVCPSWCVVPPLPLTYTPPSHRS